MLYQLIMILRNKTSKCGFKENLNFKNILRINYIYPFNFCLALENF